MYVCMYCIIVVIHTNMKRSAPRTTTSCSTPHSVDTLCDGCERSLHSYVNELEQYYHNMISKEADEYCKRHKLDANVTSIKQMMNYHHDNSINSTNIEKSTKDLRFITPFCCLLAGKSQSGKSELALTILRQWRLITNDHDGVYTKRLYWFYGTRSEKQLSEVRDIYESYRRELDDYDDPTLALHFIDGTNKEEMVRTLTHVEHAIVVLDDLMMEIGKSEELMSLFTRESHHKKLCIFYMWQDIFPKKTHANTISKNTQYKIIFPNPTTNLSLKTMLQHIHPTNSKQIFEKINSHIYHQPRHSYPYVVVRTEANADPDLMYTINSISRDPIENVKCGMLSKPPRILTM